MPVTYENWLCIVQSSVYYTCQTREINQVVHYYSVDFKVPKELWNPLSKSVLSNSNFVYSIKDL